MQEVLPAQRILADPAADPYERAFLWIVVASCLVHVVLASVTTLLPKPRPIDALPDVVAVEILTPEAFETLSHKEAAKPEAIPVSPADPRDGMVHATRLYAADLLAEPGSRQAREALPTLAENERILQLCNLEAMEQVHRWKAAFQPEFAVAYAMADVEIANDHVHADGGAFRSHDHWYNIKFECTVSPDHERVVDFAFSVGAEIPPSQWESHYLTLDTDPDD